MSDISTLRTLAASEPAQALDSLIALFVAEEYEVSRPAKAALIEWPDAATSPRLAAAIASWGPTHSIATSHALEVLGRRHDESALPTILEAARADDRVVRRSALFALGAFATDEAIAMLRDALRTPDDQNAFDRVTEGLAELARPDVAYRLLVECVPAGDARAARALFVVADAAKRGRAVDARWGDEALAWVRSSNESSNESIRASAITLLAEVAHPDKADRLLGLATEMALPAPLLAALGKTRDPRAIDVLLAAMDEPPVPFGGAASPRGVAAAAALRHFGDASLTSRAAQFVVGQLRLVTETWERGAWHAEQACAALRLLGDRAVVADLRAIHVQCTKRGARAKAHRIAKERTVEALAAVVDALSA